MSGSDTPVRTLNVMRGVAQEFVLGPLLFSIFIDVHPDVLKFPYIFADKLKTFLVGRNHCEVELELGLIDQ